VEYEKQKMVHGGSGDAAGGSMSFGGLSKTQQTCKTLTSLRPRQAKPRQGNL
jgi:hypothetical protein